MVVIDCGWPALPYPAAGNLLPSDTRRLASWHILRVGSPRTGDHILSEARWYKRTTDVRVARRRDANGQEYFQKSFEQWFVDQGWPQRENRLLALIHSQFGKYSGVAIPYGQKANADGGFVSVVETFDAGDSVAHWQQRRVLNVSSQKTLLGVFSSCTHWWRLLHACLIALDKLHPWGFVHLDLKANNICVPVQKRGDGSFRLLFDEVRFIDLTFSRHEGIPFENPLPLEPNPRYQSPAMQRALANMTLPSLNRLDYRCDLYSLGCLMEDLLTNTSPDDAWSRYRLEQADAIIATLKSDQDEPDLRRKLIQKCKVVLEAIGGQDEWWQLSAATPPGSEEADHWRLLAIALDYCRYRLPWRFLGILSLILAATCVWVYLALKSWVD